MNPTRKISSTIFAMLALAALHCGGATSTPENGDGGGGGDGGIPGVPDMHRPTATTCSMTRPAGIVDAGVVPDSGIPSFDNCETDADCTQGKNGRCGHAMGNRAGNSCSYDACFADSDCPSTDACVCAASGNVCVTAACHIDSDCGPSGYCSPSTGASCSGTAVNGYYCHTASDDCAKDSDCKSTNLGQTCGWDSMSKKWTCQPISVCAG